MSKLLPIDQVVADWDLDMVDPKKWLERQIRAGRVTARKIGRKWYMTPADVDAALEVFASKPRRTPVVEDRPRGVLSAASLKRRIA